MSMHGTVLDECIQRYSEIWTLARPEVNIKKFLKKWVGEYIIYLTDTPSSKEIKKMSLSDKELAVLLHFFSLHGRCI